MSPRRIPIVGPYHLERTLRSGQCFRWDMCAGPVNGAGGTAVHRYARGIVDGTVAIVTQFPDGLSVTWDGPAGSLARLRHHLGADQALARIESELSRDRILRRLLPRTSGIALMRQDPWECLVSFVISAFNNIPKISQSVRHLSARFGGQITASDWSFPSPARLADASLPELRRCVLGYRAPYVRALARLVADGTVDLTAVARLPHEDARAALLDLPGVGEKVADCVLLFGLGRYEAFPVDVWVQRAVERWYFRDRTVTPCAIRDWARDRFGPLAGYAQQHLFAGARVAGSSLRVPQPRVKKVSQPVS